MNDIVHAAVRRDLARMEAALRAFPDGDAERARQLQKAWANLWEQLHHHHESEDAYIWPYLRGLDVLDAKLLDDMESEHGAMGAAIGSATAAIDALVADPTASVAASGADQVAEAARVTDAHLVHEETAVQPVIIEHMETPGWKAVEKQLRKGPPTLGGRMFAWVQDGATPEVQKALRGMIPGPVLFVLSRGLGRGYYRDVAPTWR